MSEPELRREIDSCVASLAQRGRPQLAQRLGAQLERLAREHQTAKAIALLELFGPSKATGASG